MSKDCFNWKPIQRCAVCQTSLPLSEEGDVCRPCQSSAKIAAGVLLFMAAAVLALVVL